MQPVTTRIKSNPSLQENNTPLQRHRHWLWITGLALIPLLVVGSLAAYAARESGTRFDQVYFTPAYVERYNTPGAVAREWEAALQAGDPALVAELTGLRRPPRIEPNADVILTILLEVDDAGYFHYLYFDVQTYERLTQYIKEVNGRYVVVPEDLYFYWDSGQWRGVFAPISVVWWLILVVAGVATSLFRVGAQIRETMTGG